MHIDKALLSKYKQEIRRAKEIATVETWERLLESSVVYCSDSFKGEMITTNNSRWLVLFQLWWLFTEQLLKDGDQEVWEGLEVEDKKYVYGLLCRLGRLPHDHYYNNGRRIEKAAGAINERG